MRRLVAPLVLLLCLGACSPVLIEAGSDVASPRLEAGALVAADGYRLPLKSWPAQNGDPRAIVLALHGFNDYANFFSEPAEMLGHFGIASYAYDQRGFGGTENRGYWHGGDQMAQDARMAVSLLKAAHPDRPLFLLGSSMGGAVTIRALSLSAEKVPVDGIVLVAPAVWGRPTMPWYQTGSLWLAAHTVPGLKLTGRGLDINPSDNIDMLIALGKDPLIIKATRVDAIWGLVNLMDEALESADKINRPVLMLYGDRDDVVPKEPTFRMIRHMRDTAPSSSVIAFYQMGYHMLLRDLAAPTVIRDIAAWIDNPAKRLPSGADAWAARVLEMDSPDVLKTAKVSPES